MERIESDTERSIKLRQEKEGLLNTRYKLRKDVDKQKHQMLEVFEKMKRKGSIDVKLIIYYNFRQKNFKN